MDALRELGARNAVLPVEARKYAVIYADPPWSFQVWSGEGKDRSAENHYPTMTQADIEALPVGDLAANDCALFMWAVMPQLPEALATLFRAQPWQGPAEFGEVYPDGMAPIVRLDGEGNRVLIDMRWGFPPPPKLGTRPVTSVPIVA